MTSTTLLAARQADIGPFTVRRLLPNHPLRTVGPFVFFDHMGPTTMTPRTAMDVPPHPHIGLATVTFLIAGSVVHRDSLGSLQTIRPGDLNWMSAGRGIVHSERRDPTAPDTPRPFEGLQLWVGLPRDVEDAAPTFAHHPAATLPTRAADGAATTLIAGTGFGMTSPVSVASPLGYASVVLEPGATLVLGPDHPQRAVYCIGRRDADGRVPPGPDASITVDGVTVAPGQLLVIDGAAAAAIGAPPDATGPVRAMVLMGAPLDGPRFLDWNFVASDRDRLARARDDWAAHRFPTIPGDDRERVELPARRPDPPRR